MLRYADPTLCALGSAVFCRLLIVPTVRTRDRPAVHCVKARPTRRLPIARAALARRGPPSLCT
jgi:hypothetical protein